MQQCVGVGWTLLELLQNQKKMLVMPTRLLPGNRTRVKSLQGGWQASLQ